MNPYMGYDREAEYGACLIFANTVREAKKVGWQTLQGWFSGIEWVDMRVRRLPKTLYIMSLAEDDKSHVIENPPGCKICFFWKTEPLIEGLCNECREERYLQDSGCVKVREGR